MITLNSVPYVNFNKDLIVGFLPDHSSHPHVANSRPIRSAAGKESSRLYGTQLLHLGTADVIPIAAGPISRSPISPSTGVTSARLAASSDWVSAVFTNRSSFSQSAQA